MVILPPIKKTLSTIQVDDNKEVKGKLNKFLPEIFMVENNYDFL